MDELGAVQDSLMTRMDIVEHRHRAGAMRILIASLMLSSFCVISVPPAAADDWPAGPPDPIKLMEMVLVKGGCYQMGDTFGDGAENERPVHEVCVKDFYIGKYAVTQTQWVGAMGTNPSLEPNCGMTCPVENVSWNEVQEFIKKLSQRTGKPYRLPTEAEWEYAARSGGKDEKWAGTSDEKQLAEYAVFGRLDKEALLAALLGENKDGCCTERVGSRKPNGLGLNDMSGNVWEWVEDCWHENYNGAPTDGRAWK